MVAHTPFPHYPALLRDVADLFAQLQAHEPADFGRIARRTSEPAERLLELLWLERETIVCLLLPTPETSNQREPDPLAYFVRGWVDWLYDKNQFFELEPPKVKALRRTHEALFRGVQASLCSAGSSSEFARRCQLSFILFAERLSRVFRSLTILDGSCGRGAEYSAELQLKLLGLAEHAWLEPIVDLGCGIDARLVRHLRELGRDATGLERRGRLPFVVAADWFDVRFEPNSLGTILSHLAFSLQFLHHHFCGDERAYDYAKKYMELLKSLRPRGLFCYAPGLPFIEAMLDPTEFKVDTLPLPEPLASAIATLRDIGTGQSVAYACQIRRRVRLESA